LPKSRTAKISPTAAAGTSAWPLLAIAALACAGAAVWYGLGIVMAPAGDGAPKAAGDSRREMWVTSEHLSKHTCPALACGVTAKLIFHESVLVEETARGWARVSPFYGAACHGGTTDLVREGNAACTRQNGIVDGLYAEWIPLDMLTTSPPASPDAAAGNIFVREKTTGLSRILATSDDFAINRSRFVNAAERLITRGQCDQADFVDGGGFKRATGRGASVYFVACGRVGTRRVILLDAQNDSITVE
jgi:hypothetical protein